MIKARSKYSTDLYGTIYIDNIQKVVVICLIIPTTFSFDAGSSMTNGITMRFILSDGWKMSAIIKFLIAKIPGCMT